LKDDTERKLNSKDIDLKSKYKNLLKFSPDFIFIHDINGNLIKVSNSKKMFRYLNIRLFGNYNSENYIIEVNVYTTRCC